MKPVKSPLHYNSYNIPEQMVFANVVDNCGELPAMTRPQLVTYEPSSDLMFITVISSIIFPLL